MQLTFLVYEGVEPIDLAAIGVISMAKRIIPELSYQIVALRNEPVELSNGLRVLPNARFDEVAQVDVLMVPGGPGWRAASQDRETLAFIRRVAAPAAATVCSVCTGAMILAAAGTLDGLHATTKTEVVAPEASPLLELRGRYPNVHAQAALLVDNGAVITGGGVSLCIDTTLHLLQRRFGRPAAEEVARILEYSAAWQANSRRPAVIRDRL